MLQILFYPYGDNGPVKNELLALIKERPKASARIEVDLAVLSTEGLRSPRLIVRPLGDKLWELKRSYDGIEYRLFLGVLKGTAWLLHFIEKKSAKTPKNDLRLARKRLKEVAYVEGL